ncbi:MAG: hypothetical protein V4490_03000 [Pseudomonadota bacterium]
MAKHPDDTDPESKPGLTHSKIDLLNVLDNTESERAVKAKVNVTKPASNASKKPFAANNLSGKKYGAALKSKMPVSHAKPGGNRGGRGK